jgi:CheY-like chemotaxis protein
MTTPPPMIMIMGNTAADAELVAGTLRPEFPALAISLEAAAAVDDFERCLPDVLVLAWRQLEPAQERCKALYEASDIARRHPHRSLVLCHTDETSASYELCKRGAFDDYIKFWPHTFDAHQLPMSVLTALHQLRAAKALGKAASELVEFADRTAAIELLLAPAGADPAGAVQTLHRRMRAIVQPALAAPADAGSASPAFDSLQSCVERIEKLAESSSALRKRTETQLSLIRSASERSHGQALGGSPKPAIVLVVEDDEFQQKMLLRLLQQEQVEVDAALTAAEADAAVRRRTPSLILLDYELPDGDGISWLLGIRSNPAWARIPVVMLTGNSDKQIVVTSMQAGASDFIVKPVDPIKLREKVRRYLNAAA